MDMKIFATRLKECREDRNISAGELAESVGINKATIHRYEKGEFKSVKQSVLESIADTLGVNPEYLIGVSTQKYNLDSLNNLNKKDKKEITDILDLTTKLLKQEGLMFDGYPADDESIQSIIDAMEIGLNMAKRRNKDKYSH